MRNQLSIRILLCMLVLSSTLAACISKSQEVDLTGLPVEISKAGTQEINVDVIIESALQQVLKCLPEAYLSSFVFTGYCQDLSELRGRVELNFVQVQVTPLKQRVWVAFASVDTVQQTLDVQIRDHSDYCWSTEPLLLQDISAAREVADIAYTQIAALGISDCDATLTRLDRTWEVVGTEPGSGPAGPRECEFEIDASTRQIETTHQ